jgi:superfamily II DNA or RNA helicase
MNTNVDFTAAKRILLPDAWSFHAGTTKLRLGQLSTLAAITPCTVQALHSGEAAPRAWVAKLDTHEVLLITKNGKADDHFTDVLRMDGARLDGDLITPGPKLAWVKHRTQRQGNEAQFHVTVRDSWQAGIAFKPEIRNEEGRCASPGLRPAQIGALHAVAAHWVVSQKPALVVMPTGTGKTEVMLACMVMSRPERLLVLVPSNALRLQTFEKFVRLGMLPAIGVTAPEIIRPVTAMLKGTPDPEDAELIKICNVVITTVAAIQHLSNKATQDFLNLFDQIYFDEAHHLPSASWNRVREFAETKKLLQFTATPFRLDGQRIPGRIIYNFPLRMAQEQGYFRKIRFLDAFSPDTEAGDAKIAELAVNQLRADLATGLNHIVLARADTKFRADALFKAYYERHADLNPTVIYSQAKGARQTLKDIRAGRHKIVVCVDMFGEGFDLPALKIAALHDPHKSLAIALQFTGRFTREAQGIGDSTVIANTADPRVEDSIEELYAEDADWNSLIPELSAKAIESQMDFSDFLERMDNKLLDEDIFGLNLLQPKTSTVIYQAGTFNPTKYRNWARRFHVEREWISKDKDLVIFITRSRIPIEWATIKDTTDEIWNLFILAYESDQKLLYIHSSQKGSLYPDLAKAVSGQGATLLEGEKMFRAFHGLNRLIFHNAGLYHKGSKLRFRMFTGLDISEAIHPSAQTNSTKSNLFGVGRENGEVASVGVSHKGRVWSMSSGSVPDWRQWCRNIGAKIQNSSISTDGYLKHTLKPREISELPVKVPLLVALPESWYGFDAESIRIYEAEEQRNADTFEIKEFTVKDSHLIEMALGWDNQPTSLFSLTWGKKDGEFAVAQVRGTTIDVGIGRERLSLAEYFNRHPPTIYFIDGSEARGGYLLESPSDQPHLFDACQIVDFDWTGVDITKESKWKNGQSRADSVQSKLIEYLKPRQNHIIFDDDDAGEVADVVEIVEEKDTVLFRFYHCKYSSGMDPAARVKDPAEVCMQAVRSTRWLTNYKRILQHLIQREKSLRGRPTRFEKGNVKMLSILKRRLRKLRCKAEICVVQPGISKAAYTSEISTMLGAANNLIQDMTGTPLKVMASK